MNADREGRRARAERLAEGRSQQRRMRRRDQWGRRISKKLINAQERVGTRKRSEESLSRRRK